MKRLSIIVPVGIVTFLGLVSVFGGIGGQADRLRGGVQQQPGIDPYEGFQGNRASQTNTGRITEANEPPMIVGDANEIRTRVKKFEGLEMALQQVEGKSREEEREWIQMEVENRLELARAVRAQMREELMLLRKLALEEKAEKTAAAIDGLLLSRQGRFTQVIQKIEDEERRLSRLEEQQQRAAGRGAPGAGRTLGRRGTQDQMTGQGGYGTYQDDRTSPRSRSRRRR